MGRLMARLRRQPKRKPMYVVEFCDGSCVCSPDASVIAWCFAAASIEGWQGIQAYYYTWLWVTPAYDKP